MVANPISKSSIENLSGGASTVLADYSAGDYTFAVVPRGIHVNVGGAAVVRFENDSSDRTVVLNGGFDYAHRIKIIRNSGTTAGMGILGLY